MATCLKRKHVQRQLSRRYLQTRLQVRRRTWWWYGQAIEAVIYERLGNHPGIIGYHGRSFDPDGIVLSYADWYGLDQFLREMTLPSVHRRFKVGRWDSPRCVILVVPALTNPSPLASPNHRLICLGSAMTHGWHFWSGLCHLYCYGWPDALWGSSFRQNRLAIFGISLIFHFALPCGSPHPPNQSKVLGLHLREHPHRRGRSSCHCPWAFDSAFGWILSQGDSVPASYIFHMTSFLSVQFVPRTTRHSYEDFRRESRRRGSRGTWRQDATARSWLINHLKIHVYFSLIGLASFPLVPWLWPPGALRVSCRHHWSYTHGRAPQTGLYSYLKHPVPTSTQVPESVQRSLFPCSLGMSSL